MINKIYPDSREALADVFDGAVVLCGGFGCVGGMPSLLFRTLSEMPVRNLTLIGNAPVLGLTAQQTAARTMTVPESFADGALLLKNGQISKLVSSVPAMTVYHMEEPFPIVTALQAGQDIEIELVPQGTLAERIRAARAGIRAFYTRTGTGTYLTKSRESRQFDDEEYLMEEAIKADFGIVRAYKADRFGNLIYRGTSRSFNATVAGAARITIVEVDEIVEPEELDPESIVTPGIYVDRIVKRDII